MARKPDAPLRRLQTQVWFHYIKQHLGCSSAADVLIKLKWIQERPGRQREDTEKDIQARNLIRATETWQAGQAAVSASRISQIEKKVPRSKLMFERGPHDLFSRMQFQSDMSATPRAWGWIPCPEIEDFSDSVYAWFNAFRVASIGWLLTEYSSIFAFRPAGYRSADFPVFKNEIDNLYNKNEQYFCKCHLDMLAELDKATPALSKFGITKDQFLTICLDQARYEAIKAYPELANDYSLRGRGCKDNRLPDSLDYLIGVVPERAGAWKWPATE